MWNSVSAAALGLFLLLTGPAMAQSPDLVGEWRFDNPTSNTATDTSGFGNDGIFIGGARYSGGPPPSTPGNVDSLAVMSGGFVRVASSDVLKIPESFTVSAWVRVNTTRGEQNIISKDFAPAAYSNYNLHIYHGRPYFALAFDTGTMRGGCDTARLLSASGGTGGCDGGGVFIWSHREFVDAQHPLGTWRAVTAVYDAPTKTLRLYLDCEPAGEATFATSGVVFTSDDALQFGLRKYAASALDGGIDEVRIWRRALAEAELGPLVCNQAPSCIELRLSDYNLFLLEDYHQGTDVEGKVAAGGNISMSSFSVGHRLPEDNISHALVAGGNLSLTSGGVWGDAWYGGSYSTDATVVFPRGTASQGTPIDFAARGAQLRMLSSQLAGLAVNGSMVLEPWGGILLRGTHPDVNVFQVDARAFDDATLLSLDAPAGSLAVINISGSSATLSGFGHSFNGGIDQHGVLYNFVEATAIDAGGYGFWGTVLAPYAHVTFSNGSFDGGIYARSMTGNAEGHINVLYDRDICR